MRMEKEELKCKNNAKVRETWTKPTHFKVDWKRRRIKKYNNINSSRVLQIAILVLKKYMLYYMYAWIAFNAQFLYLRINLLICKCYLQTRMQIMQIIQFKYTVGSIVIVMVRMCTKQKTLKRRIFLFFTP